MSGRLRAKCFRVLYQIVVTTTLYSRAICIPFCSYGNEVRSRAQIPQLESGSQNMNPALSVTKLLYSLLWSINHHIFPFFIRHFKVSKTLSQGISLDPPNKTENQAGYVLTPLSQK